MQDSSAGGSRAGGVAEGPEWGGVIWRVRRALSWWTAWCSCGRRTRWSRRCCGAGGRSRPPAGCARRRSMPRERLVRRFLAFTNEFPWQWGPAHVDEWTLTLTAEQHLAPATIRGYQTELRLFSEYLTDARYGWAAACEEAFGDVPGADLPRVEHDRAPERVRGQPGGPAVHPGGAAAVPGLRRRSGRPGGAGEAQGGAGRLPGRHAVQGDLRLGAAAHRDREAGSGRLGPQSGGGGVRPVRDAARPLWQGGARAAAAAAQRRLGDGLGGGGGGRLRGEHPAPLRAASIIRRCG